jgi:drug/metabolite transporter (DMT)-like permease
MTLPAAPPRRDHVPLGILYMVGATVIFVSVNGVVKWEVALYPVGEVMFARTVFALLACCLLSLPRTGLAALRTERLGDHVKRGASQFCSQMCLALAFKLMPLAGAIAISFSAPLFTTLLSALLLKETVGVHRWAALVVGFLGVLLVTEPGAGSLQMGAAFALGNAILFSTVTIAVRRMSATESTATLTIYQLGVITILMACLLPFGFVLPTGQDALILALGGLANGVAQYWWTKALQLAPASAVVPFHYMSMVWAMIIGFAVWGDTPSIHLLVGSGIVVASGLYLLWRETERRRAATAQER